MTIHSIHNLGRRSFVVMSVLSVFWWSISGTPMLKAVTITNRAKKNIQKIKMKIKAEHQQAYIPHKTHLSISNASIPWVFPYRHTVTYPDHIPPLPVQSMSPGSVVLAPDPRVDKRMPALAPCRRGWRWCPRNVPWPPWNSRNPWSNDLGIWRWFANDV